MKHQSATLTVHALSKSFGSHNVLVNIEYQFVAPRTYALLGVSGTGKSTFINLLAGFDTPDVGSVTTAHIACLMQTPLLLDELSVLENVIIQGLIAGQQLHDLGKKLLDQVDLADKADSAPRTLSGGEQQRVALARALLLKPDFIIADEPTAHLDPASKEKMLKLLLAQNIGLIIASHDTVVAQAMDTVLELKEGGLYEAE